MITDKAHQTVMISTLHKHIEKINQYGFDYIGGYDGNKTPMMIRCQKCGAIRTVTGDYLGRKPKEGRSFSIVCDECMKINTRNKQEEIRKAKKQERKTISERRKAIKNLIVSINKISHPKEVYVVKCKRCGRMFETERKDKIFCSDICSKRYRNSTHWNRRRAYKKNAMEDGDIHIKLLYQREDGICYLCGKKCDWNDCKTINGVFISGNNYPSIDHVIPLSKGGKHSWDNVRLAHRICNIHKRDRYLPTSRMVVTG